MSTRKKLLSSHCGTKSGRVNTGVFYSLPSLLLSWCPVFKAASTNWMHNLLHLAGKSEKEIEAIVRKHPGQPNDQARVVAPVLSDSKTRAAVTGREGFRGLIIVRHPFDRLVSAFRDKLERCPEGARGPKCSLTKQWYYQKYGKKIVATHRKAAEMRFGPDFFSEKSKYGAPYNISNGWRSAQLPSWWEFVQFILATHPARYDEHWKPSTLYCSTCSFPFNFILHFESLGEEEEMFARMINVSDVIHPRWENSNKSPDISREELLHSYFSLLDDDEILALYNIYKEDFLQFGYTFQYRGLRLNMPQPL